MRHNCEFSKRFLFDDDNDNDDVDDDGDVDNDNSDDNDDDDDDGNDEDEDDLRRNKIDQVESNCKMDFFLNQDRLN